MSVHDINLCEHSAFSQLVDNVSPSVQCNGKVVENMVGRGVPCEVLPTN